MIVEKPTKEIYAKAREVLARDIDPVYYEIARKIEPKIEDPFYLAHLLEYRMSPDGAKIINALPDEGWTEEIGRFKASDAFCQRVGFPADMIEEQLEESYYYGDVMWFGRCEITSSSTLWHDIQHSKKVKKPHGQEYYVIMGWWFDRELTQTGWDDETEDRISKGQRGIARIVPRFDSVSDHPDFHPAENIYELMKQKEILGITNCICRLRTPELGLEAGVCIGGGDSAKFGIDIGVMEEISLDEAFDRIQTVGKKEPHCHIHKHTDTIEITGNVFCNCQADACIIMRKQTVLGSDYQLTYYYGKSRYRAKIDPGKCINCGLCIKKRCMFDAILLGHDRSINDMTHYVSTESCMGCGCCVETCPSKAISMICVEPVEYLKGIDESKRRVAGDVYRSELNKKAYGS